MPRIHGVRERRHVPRETDEDDDVMPDAMIDAIDVAIAAGRAYLATRGAREPRPLPMAIVRLRLSPWRRFRLWLARRRAP